MRKIMGTSKIIAQNKITLIDIVFEKIGAKIGDLIVFIEEDGRFYIELTKLTEPPQEVLDRIEYFEEQKKELENEKIIAILDEEISKIKKLWNIVDITEIKQNKEAK